MDNFYLSLNVHTCLCFLILFILPLLGSVVNLVGLSPVDISSGVDIAERALWVSNLARLELDCAEWNMESSTWDRLAEEALLCWGTLPGVGFTDENNKNRDF